MIDTVSALYVMPDGPYPSLVSDWWDEARDARLYDGPNPVVAHPPCARWGNYWWSDGSKAPGDDAGCFEAAIGSVRRFGGVLEHPEGTRAWSRFGIHPPTAGAWTRAMFRPDEWVAVVDQHCWGHRARKRTWLVAVGVESLPDPRLHYGEVKAYVASGPGKSLTAASRREHGITLISKREKKLTPDPFARLLVDMAASVHP